MKIIEVNKLRKRKNKDKDLGVARENMHIADMYHQSGKIEEALTNYKLALKMSKDRDPEIEALCHFKIGRIMI